MASEAKTPPLSADIQSLLAGLRWRIRAFVWLEGIALTLLWLGCTFWVAFSLDYLPVLVGASEMPFAARAILLPFVLLVACYIFYRWILLRTFVKLSGRSMALLLERRFGQFHDSLLTSVELSERPDHAKTFNREMLDHARHEAQTHTGEVKLGQVFNFGPLAVKILGAVAVVASLAALAKWGGETPAVAFDRLVKLSDKTYRRLTKIELVGFTDGVKKVARGGSVEIEVRADIVDHEAPSTCVIYYATDPGDGGRLNMRKDGAPRDGYQRFIFDGKPFDGMLDSLTFEVIGYDHRIGKFRVEVVDSPAIVETLFDSDFPKYTERAGRRNERLQQGLQLARGSKITLTCRTNKPIKELDVRDAEGNPVPAAIVSTARTLSLAPPEKQRGAAAAAATKLDPNTYSLIRMEVDSLSEPIDWHISLVDTDDIASQKPHRLAIGVIEDRPPVVSTRHPGITNAITAQALIPTTGTITDDYDLSRAWIRIEYGAERFADFDFEPGKQGEVDAGLDLRDRVVKNRVEPSAANANPGANGEAAANAEPSDEELAAANAARAAQAFVLEEGKSIVVTVMAADKFDLTDTPNIGHGDRYELEVVSPDELLRRVDVRELAMRRRLEQIVEELRQTRDSLARVRPSHDPLSGSAGSEPEDALDRAAAEPEDNAGAEPGEGEPDAAPVDPRKQAEQLAKLRLLRVQRAQQHSERAVSEIMGVALGFDDIRQELENNRIDSAERKERLDKLVAAPLKRICEQDFKEWDVRLALAENAVGDPELLSAPAQQAVDQIDKILVNLEKVLENMIDMESYNELVDILRAIIAEENALIEETKKQREESTSDLE